MSKSYLYFTRPINEQTAAALVQTAFNVSFQTKCDELVILMSSVGGGINYGFDIYHQLRTIPIKLTTVNIGSIESIAVPVFLSGEKRFAIENSKFKLHPFSWTFASNVMNYPDLREAIVSLDSDVKRYSAIIKERTTIDKSDIQIEQCLTMSPKILSPNDALTYGFIDDVTTIDESFFEPGRPRVFVNA